MTKKSAWVPKTTGPRTYTSDRHQRRTVVTDAHLGNGTSTKKRTSKAPEGRSHPGRLLQERKATSGRKEKSLVRLSGSSSVISRRPADTSGHGGRQTSGAKWGPPAFVGRKTKADTKWKKMERNLRMVFVGLSKGSKGTLAIWGPIPDLRNPKWVCFDAHPFYLDKKENIKRKTTHEF